MRILANGDMVDGKLANLARNFISVVFGGVVKITTSLAILDGTGCRCAGDPRNGKAFISW